MTQQQLESYLFGAADLLRGLIDAADFKQYIFPLVFFKRVSDVWDEEFQAGLEFIGDGDEEWVRNEYPMTFNIPEDCHWNDVRNTAKNVGAKLQSAFINIEAANPTQLQGIFGTFGDTVWTNSLKFTDAKIKDLLEHFSAYTLSTQNVPADLMGAGYEFLIKKFADDGGHTAAEFYTNRTVVRLMTMLCDPQPDETIYDPTCGSGGMLIEAWAYLKHQQKEHESLWLYGQEKNIITSSIARMNMALHNISNFDIKQGDTLDDPKFLNQDTLQQFDVILANPPYSIKKWNRKAFEADRWKRNRYGIPPQGCADYAFQQHILTSLSEKGRCAVLWPHGVLFRDAETHLRTQMIQEDKVEAVIGLGGNLFYNSSMESCIVVCRQQKTRFKRKIIFINAVQEIERVRSMSNLLPQHIERILNVFRRFEEVPHFSKVVDLETVLANQGNLSIPLYVVPKVTDDETDLNDLVRQVKRQALTFQSGLNHLFNQLHHAGF